VIGKGTWNEMLTLTLAYAPDYSNLDYSSFYVNLGGSWEIGNEFSLNAGVGHSDFSDDNGSYNDWNIGVSAPGAGDLRAQLLRHRHRFRRRTRSTTTLRPVRLLGHARQLVRVRGCGERRVVAGCAAFPAVGAVLPRCGRRPSMAGLARHTRAPPRSPPPRCASTKKPAARRAFLEKSSTKRVASG
jgi:hypothetical protein